MIVRFKAAIFLTAIMLFAASSGVALAQQQRRLTVPSDTERRLALVIGSDSYADAPLQNARNDARTMARTLEGLGFQVTLVENASRSALGGAMAAFGDRLRPTDVALFYFAGHGVQVDGDNFLIPTDFSGRSANDVRLNALRASEIQQVLQTARIAMLILDACRNNPFVGTRGGSGLASMEARGSLVAFATGAGQTAADAGSGANGLFTQELVKTLAAPGLTVQDVFRRVRQSVYEASGGRQFPAVYDGLLGEFVFRSAAPATPRPAASAPAAADGDLALRAELSLWDAIKDTRTPALLEDFLRQFPNGRFRAVAQERLSTLGSSSPSAPPAATAVPVPPRPVNPSPAAAPIFASSGTLSSVSPSARVYEFDAVKLTISEEGNMVVVTINSPVSAGFAVDVDQNGRYDERIDVYFSVLEHGQSCTGYLIDAASRWPCQSYRTDGTLAIRSAAWPTDVTWRIPKTELAPAGSSHVSFFIETFDRPPVGVRFHPDNSFARTLRFDLRALRP